MDENSGKYNEKVRLGYGVCGLMKKEGKWLKYLQRSSREMVVCRRKKKLFITQGTVNKLVKLFRAMVEAVSTCGKSVSFCDSASCKTSPHYVFCDVRFNIINVCVGIPIRR
jgi:hypothetical protein